MLFSKLVKQPSITKGDNQIPLGLESKLKTHSNGFRTCVYYSDWSIYDRNHFPEDIPLDVVTNIFYAFFNVDPNTGNLVPSDRWADIDIPFQSPYDPNQKMNGLLARFFEIKQRNRHVKVSISIGGWSNSQNFKKGVNTPDKLNNFVASALHTMSTFGFDGIDLDWEYPENKKQAGSLLQIMRNLRFGMRELEKKRGLDEDSYLLTIASPAFEEKLHDFHVEAMDKYLSFWNLMTYDFAGAWSEKASYHCNLYKKKSNELCADDSVKYFTSRGIDPSKLTLGMANYGRSFTKTSGYGTKFVGVGKGSSDEDGIWNYNKLPLPGAKEEYDPKAAVAFSYNEKTKTFVSYDNVDSVKVKAQYVIDKGLGGGMWWESCGDRYNEPNKSLIHNFVKALGGKGRLDTSNNTVKGYTESEYLIANFGDSLFTKK